MIMGDICTRNCAFCSVENGVPIPLDSGEPLRVADAARSLALRHVVVTSVTRDDINDHGAQHFAQTVMMLRKVECVRTIEVLTSDCGGKIDALGKILDSNPDVFNHNVETVPALYPRIRPKACYERSLHILKRASQAGKGFSIKSGLMVGFGETEKEVLALLDALKGNGCSIVTIGQYLRPSLRNIPVQEYVSPDKFAFYEEFGTSIGLEVIASPLVRSSYKADLLIQRMHDGCLPAGDHRTGNLTR